MWAAGSFIISSSLPPSLPSYLSLGRVRVHVNTGRREVEGKADEGVGVVGKEGGREGGRGLTSLLVG